MEYEHEKEEFKRQTETMGVARKVKRGLCWYPASPGRSYYNSLNQLVIDITRTENKEIEHSFEFGRPVCFFRQSFDGKVNYMNFIATVSYADDERMVVVLPSAGALLELQTEEVLGVQLYFDETSYRAMFEALEDVIRAKGNRLAELRDTLLGTQKPGFRELYPVRFPWLNSTQETAVNKVLCTRDVAIVHGPPGTGKTTLARVIANTTSAEFTQLNATTAGKKDMEEVVKEAQQRIGMYGKKTILFVDEIHRFNKGQQDYLLPFVEDGTLVLIGATTENPYFEVNGALISRSIIFELKPLEKEDIEKLLERAVTDPVKGLGTYNVVLDADAKEFLADIAGGDARAALNAIELGVLSTERQADGKIHIDLETASECIQKRVVRYDKTGDQHYDTISAFIKSMRGSDPDAAVFYLAKMLYAGEDIKFIARRIMICAAEDVGLADPNALNVAVSASLAVERVGMPEAQIILAEAATYVACAPKSNSSCEAVFAAMKTVGSVRTSVPPHLQDAHYKGSAKLGHGQGYQYAHDYPNHYVEQQYLPDEILGSRFLHLGTNGYEQKIRENFKKIGKDIE